MKSTVIDPLVFSAFAAELVKISSVEQQQVSEQPKKGLRGNPAIEDKSKTASTEEAPKKKESPYLSVGKLLGAGALGFGAGTGAGVLAGYGADKVYEKVTGKRIPKEFVFGVAPLLAGAAGTAYSVYKAKEQEAIQRALENRKESGAG